MDSKCEVPVPATRAVRFPAERRPAPLHCPPSHWSPAAAERLDRRTLRVRGLGEPRRFLRRLQ